MDGQTHQPQHSPALLALALIAGATAALSLPGFPSAMALGVVAVAIALLAWCARTMLPLAFFIGAILALLSAYFAMAARISPADVGRVLTIEGQVADLPRVGKALTRFSVEAKGFGLVRLSWYGAPEIKVGERWSLSVKLRRPRGTFNPGLLDFEQLALRQGLVATGYVQRGEKRRAAAADSWLVALRHELSSRINASLGPRPSTALVQALALGDQRGMSKAQWDLLRASGTTHLFAISGFHIGMIALLCVLCLRTLSRVWQPTGQGVATYPWFNLVAVLAALAYGMLVGFAIPTARTCLLLLLFAGLLLARRRLQPAHALLLVGGALVLVNPLSVLAPGFWLSFLSVAGLIYALGGRARQSLWRELLAAQWASTVLLLPLSLLFFGQFCFAAVPANFLAIPLISLLIVPLALVGTAAEGLVIGGGWLFLKIAALLLEALFVALQWLSTQLQALTLYALDLAPWKCALAVLGGIIVLAPRGLPARPLGLLLLLVLLPTPNPLPSGAWRMTVLDVGQGQATLIETAHHRLLIDTGPAYGEDADAGDRVVVPSLLLRQILRLDRLIVSHGDQDHAGGLDAVVARFKLPVQSSDPRIRQLPCIAGESFELDAVKFTLLHPTPGLPYLKNTSSCVLRVDSAGGSALLPGDIDDIIEQRLVRDQRGALDVDVLLVPHHGSTSSSTAAFIAAVSPRFAVVAAGFQNRFDFPRAEVMARYRSAGATIANTADDGQIALLAQPGQPLQLFRSRPYAAALWRE